MKFIRALYLATSLSLSAYGAMAQSAASGYFLHTVTKGQSLYSISSMYNVTTDDIIRLNPGSDKTIRAGETLKIPQIEKSTEKKQFHTIKPGETLYKITKMYNIPAYDICNANPGLSAENFKAGQVIVLPLSSDKKSVDINTNIGTIEKQEQKYQTIHKVAKKETVYSICRKYGITPDELTKANKELKDSELKKGMFLQIPYHLVDSETVIPTDKELFSNNKKAYNKISTIKAAVLLPFMTNGENKKEQAKMVEYYEGFLLAVDSLKKQGTNVDIYTYDTGNGNAKLETILAKPEMKDMNIIFGPAFSEQIEIVSDFAKKNKIRMVVPFTSKGEEVFTNPYIYQVNTPQSYLYSQVYDNFKSTFKNSNVIFLNTGSGNGEKAEFIKGLKDELKSSRISYKDITISDTSADDIIQAMSLTKDNVFIPLSGSNVALIKILPQLIVIGREHPEFTLKLFGYPEWQTYTQDHLENFHELDTYFYSSFFTNNLFPNSAKYASDFRKNYSKTLALTYPKYGILGFDTGYFFLKALSDYGTTIDSNINKVPFRPVQHGFKFDRVNNWGGFINKKVFFIHYSKNHELVKLEFDK